MSGRYFAPSPESTAGMVRKSILKSRPNMIKIQAHPLVEIHDLIAGR